MKEIPIPAPVLICKLDGTPVKDENGKQTEHSFEDYAMARLADSGMGNDMEAVLRVLKLRDSLREAIATGGPWRVEDADYKVLRNVTKSPKPGYNPDIAHCLIPHMLAITEAK
jgi:hypothetical protein